MSNTEKEVVEFNLQVPIDVPDEEELKVFSGLPKEPMLQHLLDTEYITEEELAAYMKFIAFITGFSPYLLDSFLGTYRNRNSTKAQS